ncbi:MAG: MerR family transcriptional regulator [Lachnospiraceae bacterium]|nr:MerR family transcriptional regulator [Lachnospiraceae bacterium]
MEYYIGDFSKLTGLSIHTLRYYEHEGLITPERNSINRRCYSDKDLTWIEFIKRLKNTGMPIKEIKHYANLRAAGDTTLYERLEILVLHRQTLNEQIAQLQEHKIKLDEKIEFYRKEIEHVNDAHLPKNDYTNNEPPLML